MDCMRIGDAWLAPIGGQDIVSRSEFEMTWRHLLAAKC